MTAPTVDPGARLRLVEAELARVRQQFAALNSRLSHDLQGVLENIAAFAGHVRSSAAERLTPREAHWLERIDAGARRGTLVARDLSSLATLAVTELRPAPLDLSRVARDTLEDLRPALQGRQVRVLLPANEAPAVAADLAMARLAVWHLLGNALKFTGPVDDPCVEVTVGEEAGCCVFAVRDNGVGFPLAEAHRLFGAFERLHHARDFEGNGIGLAVVKEFASRHGGYVGAEVPEDGGSRFWFALPLSSTRAQADAQPAPSRRRLIVAVDDEPLVLMTVKTALERDGDEVLTALGGAQGLRLVRDLAGRGREVDVVVCDWLMPGCGGTEVTQAARALHPASRIVVLSGMGEHVGGPRLPHGVDAVLPKPIRAGALRSAVLGRPAE